MAESILAHPNGLPALEAVLAHPAPPPGPDLDAIVAHDEHSLPYTDDQPLPDGRVQQGPLGYSRDAIRHHLRSRRDGVAVDGDMFVYYIGRDRHGKPALASIAPDVFVVFGVADRSDRNSYPLWREPDADLRFVLEIGSSSTRARDHGAKRSVYASLGVREYFLFDPPGRRRRARIMGLTLRSGGYSDMPTEVLPNGGRGVRSAVLDLVAYVNGEGELRWFDPVAGVDLFDYVDLHRQRDEAEARAAKAEAKAAELEALLRPRADPTPER